MTFHKPGFGERVWHIRADLNIELHHGCRLSGREAARKGYLC